MAGWTGLEPAASGVTGRRSNQLNYDPEKFDPEKCDSKRTGARTAPVVGGEGFEPATPCV